MSLHETLLEQTVNTTGGEYLPYTYKGKIMLVERFLLLGEVVCPQEEFDFLDMEIHPIAQEKMADIRTNGFRGYTVFDDKNRELFNTFRYYEEPQDKRIFLYSEVYSSAKTKVIVHSTGTKTGKLWVNGECLIIHNYPWNSQFAQAIYLMKGLNTIFFEQYSPDDKVNLSIQIRNYAFESSAHVCALSHSACYTHLDTPFPVPEYWYIPSADEYRFMYMGNNSKFLPEYRIDLYDSSVGFLRSFTARVNEPVTINVGEIRNLHEEALRHITIGCFFKDKNGAETFGGLCVMPCNFYARAQEIAAELTETAKEASVELRAQIEGNIMYQKILQDRKDHNSLYWKNWELYDLLKQIQSGSFAHERYKKPGGQEYFIHSSLDDDYVWMGMRIPDGYTGDAPYPAIFALATGYEGWWRWNPPIQGITDGCLIFDITGRGFTGGSYIGEASTLEIIEWIFQHYNIDRDRVYVTGQSNGGFASWALAQNRPHLAAALYPQIGYPAIENIDNVANVPTWQIVSPKDHVFVGRENEVRSQLNKHGNYHQINFKEMLHGHLGDYCASPIILKDMLQHKRNRFPNTIIYRTTRNRHLESFWIRLHGIAAGKKYAKVTAAVINATRLNLRLQNVDGITVTLPPQIDRTAFTICINGHEMDLSDYSQPRIILKREKRKWTAADNEPVIDYRKGTGLLDVYMDSLRIIVPDAAEEGLCETAESIAHPNTNGVFPEIHVHYPIYAESTVPDHIFQHNLVLLDVCGSNGYVRRFAGTLPVQCNEDGYSYGDRHIAGDYVVMQVIPNPYDSRRTFLIISTNQPALLKKHILLRSVIIPTYINGIHPLWNNEILAFDGKSYLAVFETGEPLTTADFGKKGNLKLAAGNGQ